MKQILLLSLLLVTTATARRIFPRKHLSQEEFPEQDERRNTNETLHVHLVPHSYNLDFLTMVDSYFPSMQEDLMQWHFEKVFDNVLASLEADHRRTFTHYEVKYFSAWYLKLSEV